MPQAGPPGIIDPPMPMWPVLLADHQSVMGTDWWRWLQRIYQQVLSHIGVLGTPKTLTGQTGSIAMQTLAIPGLQEGTAYIHWYLECTVAAGGTTDTLQVQVGWTHGGRSLTRVWPPSTNDTIGANASATIPVLVDANSPITYTVPYSGSGGAYTFSIWVTQ